LDDADMGQTAPEPTKESLVMAGLRLSLAGVIAGSLALVLAPGAAHAVTPTSEISAAGDVHLDSGDCVLGPTSGDAYDTDPTSSGSPLALDGRTTTKSGSGTVTATASADPTDVVTSRLSSSISAAVTPGAAGLGGFKVAATAAISQTSTKGAASTCSVDANAGGQVAWQGTITRPGWLTVTSSASGGAVGELYVISGALDGSDIKGGLVQQQLGKMSGTTTLWMAAGSYQVMLQLSAEVDPSVSTGPTPSGTLTATGSFLAAGAASAGAVGPTKYAALPAAVDCVHHTAAITLATATAKAAKVAVSVDGHVVSTAKGAGVRTVSVPAAGAVKLSVTVTPKAKKAKKHGKHAKHAKKVKKPAPVTVSRSYASCS
jgi:hypothetical protein